MGIRMYLTQMKSRISADMALMGAPQDGNLEPENLEVEIDEEGNEWTPSYSQTRILRREPTSSFTRILRHSLDRAREFSTLGHALLTECPECKALLWSDNTARMGHVNWHKFIDEQLGIQPDEMEERAWARQKVKHEKALKRKPNSR